MRKSDYQNCPNCGTLVLKSAMADHWIIARHIHSTLLPGSAEHDDRRNYPEAYRQAVPDVLRARRRS